MWGGGIPPAAKSPQPGAPLGVARLCVFRLVSLIGRVRWASAVERALETTDALSALWVCGCVDAVPASLDALEGGPPSCYLKVLYAGAAP